MDGLLISKKHHCKHRTADAWRQFLPTASYGVSLPHEMTHISKKKTTQLTAFVYRAHFEYNISTKGW